MTARRGAGVPRDGTVVIVAPRTDTHAATVEHVLRTRLGVDVLVWDTERIEDGISFGIDPDRLTLAAGDRTVDLAEVRSLWWRRPGGYGLHADRSLTPEVRRFCEREYASLLLGGIGALGTSVVNHPHAEAAAQRKPLQLSTARRVGLPVPETLISNDAERVREFWERHGRDCVYKTLTPAPRFVETRRLTAADLESLPSLSLAPMIVQRRLAGVDVRLTVIGSRQFAAVARTELPEAETDWRIDLTLQWQPYALDEDVGARVRCLLTELGLHYGCVDLRLDADGTPHFLEVNPSGQFLFIEVDTGQPVVSAMCELLMDPGAP